jgi:YidC/Oxa1 family membrane protein insertase
MFTTLIVKPLFNLLVLIYALLPGHDFGLAIIIFTIIIRLLLWPLVKKQLHHAKAMRELQPELKRIKQAAKGNRQQESMMVMQLYKEREINPFASLGLVIVQIPLLFGLYIGLQKIIQDPKAIVDFSYPFIQNFGWIEQLASNISRFDYSLLGLVDLSRPALNTGGGIYWPAMMLVIGSVIAQYYQSKQLLPNSKDSRGLRSILKEAGQGKKADQTEVNAAVGKSTRYLLPAMIFIFTVNLASALSLYWLVGGVVAYIQQARVLKQDETELEAVADKSSSKVIEGEVIDPKPKSAKTKRSGNRKKRKKR